MNNVRRSGNRLSIVAAVALLGVSVLTGVVAGRVMRSGVVDAASANISVQNNNILVSQDRPTSTQTITRSSRITVKDTEATYGYALSAKISENTLTNSTVTIGSTGSTTCSVGNPCLLSSTARDIVVTENNYATGANGEAMEWVVSISVPANTDLGNYIVEITYDEVANEPPPLAATITYPSAGQVLASGTTSTTLSVMTNKNALCRYGLSNLPFDSLPNNFGSTWGRYHSQTISGMTGNSPSETYYVACQVGEETTTTQARTWSIEVKNLGAMQSLTNAACPETKSIAYDTRNGQYYYVRKIAGTCWMQSNLRYAYGTQISSPTTSSYTVAQYMNPGGSTEYTNTSATGGFYGYLYNWCAAMGGQTSACQSSTASQPSASASVCPSGWRLPTGDSTSGELKALNTAANRGSYSTDEGLRTNAFMVYAGMYNTSSLSNVGNTGYIWSSTVFSASGAYIMGYTPTSVTSGNAGNKYNGLAVRCVL